MITDSFAGLQGIEMSEEEAERFLREQGYGVLSLARDNEAYGVPLSYGYDGESLYFVLLRPGEQSRKTSSSARRRRRVHVARAGRVAPSGVGTSTRDAPSRGGQPHARPRPTVPVRPPRSRHVGVRRRRGPRSQR